MTRKSGAARDSGTTDLYDRVAYVAERGLWLMEGPLRRYHGGLPDRGQDPS